MRGVIVSAIASPVPHLGLPHLRLGMLGYGGACFAAVNVLWWSIASFARRRAYRIVDPKK